MNRRRSPPSSKPHILDFSFQELEKDFAGFPGEKYRLGQLCGWIFKKRAASFEAMTDLPKELRGSLERAFALRGSTVEKTERASDGTVKFTFASSDRKSFSCVFLPHEKYNSLCISTQVGCAWGCRFCASGLVPFQRNLTSGEILDQIFWAEEETGAKISNILFMGMGEPLANVAGTVKAVRWFTAREGLMMSPSRITLSTTGVAPQIRKIAAEKLNVNLALSLHAADDALRKKIMPLSARFPLTDVLSACRIYQEKNRCDFTIEYILLRNVNDTPLEAEKLARQLEGARFRRRPKVNLIPYNPVPSLPFEAPEPESIRRFFALLRQKGFLVHGRKPQGQDIGAACGQLR